MFTGIIEELGQVERISRQGNVVLLGIKASLVLKDIKIGDSIAVNGVCLTITKIEQGILYFQVMQETLSLTNLGAIRINERVNLERALRVGDRLSGHFVTGHVDSTGIIRRKDYLGGNLSFEIAFPVKFASFVVSKGSVAVDGISLTVVSKKSDTFSVYIIPHTLNNTTLNFKGPSDKVNIEFDMLLKKQ